MVTAHAMIAVFAVLSGGAASAADDDGPEQCSKLIAQYRPLDKVPWGNPAVAAAFQGACDSGGSYCCARLGHAYFAAEGVERQPDRAIVLFQRARDGGVWYGCTGLGSTQPGVGEVRQLASAVGSIRLRR